MSESIHSHIVTAIQGRDVVRAKELRQHGVTSYQLSQLVAEGTLIRRARGVYMPADAPVTEFQSLLEACIRVPQGVVCLLSALRFHDLTTQNPADVWLALPAGARMPKEPMLSLQCVHMGPASYDAGIERHIINDVELRVYNPAKTVADCFKFRNSIGTDVAIEALRDYRSKRGSVDTLWYYAKVCRVANVIRPYLEAIG